MKKTVRLRGLDFAVEDRGQGDPVVLVHGFPLTRDLWTPVAEDLARDARVVTFDLRHHGETGGDDEPTTMDDFAADLLGMLDALGIERAVVGGLSMGGYLLLHAVGRAPERFRSLLLVDTRAMPDTEEAKKGRHESAARVRREGPGPFVTEFGKKLVSKVTLEKRPDVVARVAKMTAQSTAAGVARTLEALAGRPSYVELLPSIDAPTLVLVGEDDVITPPDVAKALADGIRGARLVVVPEAGHVSPIERPDVVASALREFLG